LLLVFVLSDKEAIGFYYDRRIEKTRPITARKITKKGGILTRKSNIHGYSFSNEVSMIIKKIPRYANIFIEEVVNQMIVQSRVDDAKRFLENLRKQGFEEIKKEKQRRKIEEKIEELTERVDSIIENMQKQIEFEKEMVKLKKLRTELSEKINEGKAEEVLHTLNNLNSNLRVKLLESLAYDLGRLKKHEDVLNLLKGCDLTSYDSKMRFTHIITDLVRGLLSENCVDEAIDFARKVEASSFRYFYEEDAFKFIIEKLCENGEVDRAIKLLEKVIKEVKARSQCFSLVMSKLLLEGDAERAKQLLDFYSKLMTRVLREEAIISDKEEIDRSIKMGEWFILHDAVEKALKNGASPDKLLDIAKKINSENFYNALAESLIENNLVDHALSIADKITSSSILGSLAEKVLRVKGDFEKSLEFAKKIDDKMTKTYTYITMGETLVEKGRFEEALKLINMPIGRKARKWILRLFARTIATKTSPSRL